MYKKPPTEWVDKHPNDLPDFDPDDEENAYNVEPYENPNSPSESDNKKYNTLQSPLPKSLANVQLNHHSRGENATADKMARSGISRAISLVWKAAKQGSS
ncbi:hypothetical protein V6N12_028324 [Hibiscus sabdariffa]|uniref:Uncharacterized protein n=1 Tax=Hibiscus sabdariffa TaxID=183260 RepID=A0ABR2F5I0_9ROSI